MHRRSVATVAITILMWTGSAWAQRTASDADASARSQPSSPDTQVSAGVPRLIQYGGRAVDPSGAPLTGIVSIVFSIYAEQQSELPLWTEVHSVLLDANGRYTVLIGSQSPEGLPAPLFATGEARWVGVRIGNQIDEARLLLLSVPYALKAADAETLGGRPASAYLLAEAVRQAPISHGVSAATPTAPPAPPDPPPPAVRGTGTANFLAKWIGADTIGNSVVFESATGNLGIGTTTPSAKLSVAGDLTTTGRVTGNSLEAVGLVDAGAQYNIAGNRALGVDNSLQNVFVGAFAGQLNTTGSGNTATGDRALRNTTNGSSNTAIGASALLANTAGSSNTAIGGAAMRKNTTGIQNTATGYLAMDDNTTGSGNTAVGKSALQAGNGGGNTAVGFHTMAGGASFFTGSENTAIGLQALREITSGANNTAAGYTALLFNSGGGNNTAVGGAALFNNTTGGNNVAVGSRAGENATTGSNNIYLGANVQGVAGESGAMYLGLQGTQTKTTIAGIRGTPVTGGEVVLIDATGRLGSAPVGSVGADITEVRAGTGLSGGGASGDVTLYLNTGFTDGLYARLAASNTFGASQTINGSLTATYLNADGTVTAGASFTGEQFPAVMSARQVAANGYAIRAQVEYEGSAVRGIHRGGISLAGFDPTAPGHGIYGLSNSSNGRGVVGDAQARTGQTAGVLGTSVSSDGIGVWGQASKFAVRGVTTATGTDASIGVEGIAHTSQGAGVKGRNDSLGGGYGVWGLTTSDGGIGVLGEVGGAAGGANIGVQGQTGSSTGTAGLFRNSAASAASPDGDILAGWNRDGRVFRVTGIGQVRANGGYLTGGADFAESVAVTDAKEAYEPGDVIVIDAAHTRTMTRSTGAYSTLVAGIYSTKPGILATPYEVDDPRVASEIPLAVVGIVPCKVTAENGPIAAGDLLVTSSTPGHAMKGTDRGRMLGAIVGKALQPLDGERGVILVLVTLQ